MRADPASRSVAWATGLAALALMWAILRLGNQLPFTLWPQA